MATKLNPDVYRHAAELIGEEKYCCTCIRYALSRAGLYREETRDEYVAFFAALLMPTQEEYREEYHPTAQVEIANPWWNSGNPESQEARKFALLLCAEFLEDTPLCYRSFHLHTTKTFPRTGDFVWCLCLWWWPICQGWYERIPDGCPDHYHNIWYTRGMPQRKILLWWYPRKKIT